MARVHNVDLESMVLQNLMQRYPIDSRGLHYHCLDSACLQPLRHAMQICCEASECSHWLGISPCGHCHIMFRITHVDTGSISIQLWKAILPILPPLLLFLPLIHTLRHITILISFTRTRPGPVAVVLKVSPTGSSPLIAQQTATKSL